MQEGFAVDVVVVTGVVHAGFVANLTLGGNDLKPLDRWTARRSSECFTQSKGSRHERSDQRPLVPAPSPEHNFPGSYALHQFFAARQNPLLPVLPEPFPPGELREQAWEHQ